MAIPKHKMGLLIAALKPKSEGSSDKKPESSSYDADLDMILDDLADAMASRDKEAFKRAMRDFHDCVTDHEEAGEESPAEEDEEEEDRY